MNHLCQFYAPRNRISILPSKYVHLQVFFLFFRNSEFCFIFQKPFQMRHFDLVYAFDYFCCLMFSSPVHLKLSCQCYCIFGFPPSNFENLRSYLFVQQSERRVQKQMYSFVGARNNLHSGYQISDSILIVVILFKKIKSISNVC